MLYSILLMAGASGESGGSGFLSFLPLIIIILILYFLLIRPQAKKQKEHKMMVENLRKGDRVLTAGGMVGIITGFKEKDNMVIVKIADNVKIELLKTSVSQILEKNKE